MNPTAIVSTFSDVGRLRTENQDAWHADVAAGLFLVSDGMGGVNAGGVAAKAVAELLPRLLRERLAGVPVSSERAPRAVLKDVIAEFSEQLRERGKRTPGLKGMGATLVLALLRGPLLFLAHVGDSRIYMLEGRRLKRMTKDHSIVAVLLEHGKITLEEAATHPFRHTLSRFIGMEGKAAVDVRIVRVKAACRLLLCSDGVTGMLSDQRLRAALREDGDPQAACRRIGAQANEAGGSDNITAMVVDLLPPGEACAPS